MSAQPHNEKPQSALIEQRKSKHVLGCSCCSLPVAVVQRNGVGYVLVVQSKHNGMSHTNAYTPEQLRMLADEMEKAGLK